jgi:hypothetical protein
MMPLSSTPTVMNTVVFPLNGVIQKPRNLLIVVQAVKRAALI